jgi:hypothetical protein
MVSSTFWLLWGQQCFLCVYSEGGNLSPQGRHGCSGEENNSYSCHESYSNHVSDSTAVLYFIQTRLHFRLISHCEINMRANLKWLPWRWQLQCLQILWKTFNILRAYSWKAKSQIKLRPQEPKFQKITLNCIQASLAAYLNIRLSLPELAFVREVLQAKRFTFQCLRQFRWWDLSFEFPSLM